MRQIAMVLLFFTAFAQIPGVSEQPATTYDGIWWQKTSQPDKHLFVAGLLEGFQQGYDTGYFNCLMKTMPAGEKRKEKWSAKPEFSFAEPVSSYVSQADLFYSYNTDLGFVPVSIVVWRMANGARVDKNFADAIREMLREQKKP